MTEDLWVSVEAYLVQTLVQPDPVLAAVLEASDAAGLPRIAVAPNEGKLLMLLAGIAGARKTLEVGTLAGYSTIWMARALPPDGQLLTLEVDPKHAEVARSNFAIAGLANVIELREGAALDTLPEIAAQGLGPFEFIFIDADKGNIPKYFTWAMDLSRRGTIIVIDNVVREGAVIEEDSEDVSVRGVREAHSMIAREPRVTATAIQTVGSKGYDGFTVVVVTDD